MERVLLVHPLRHHSYYSLKGLQNYTQDGYGFYGYYNKHDVLDLIVKNTSYASKLQGYSADFLEDKSIITDLSCKFNFLLAKYNSKYMKDYLDYFDRKAAKKIKDYQVLHVLQDYCNITIREAKKNGIPYIYEQIQPFDIAQIECLKKEIEIVGFPETYIHNRFPKEKIEKQIENLESATAIIAASEETEKSLVGYTNKPVYTFPYGASIKIYDTNNFYKNKQDVKILKALYVGSISLIKGVHYLINLAEKLKNMPIHFTFVGNPVVEEDQRLVNKILELKNCTYIKSIPHVKIVSLYQKNDVFLFQGLCEGFGMVTLEAMANGLPCLVSVGGRGVVEEGVTGYINRNGDVESLANNLVQLYSDHEKLNKMRIAAIETVKKYSWKKFSDNIACTYKKSFSN